MNKQKITIALTGNYTSFIQYVNGLTTDAYLYNHYQKWTAAQQLEHIVLCVQPLVQVFGMDKAAIAQTFGKTDRQSRSPDELLDLYLEKLQEGGKAPQRFVPENNVPKERSELTEALSKLVDKLKELIDGFTEAELDTLLIPHPLLGNLTLREMLYNAIYHVQHHQDQSRQHLRQMAGPAH